MSKEPKSIKISFSPGCFDNFEGTQEELDEFILTLKKMAESGELLENAIRVEDLDEYLSDDSIDEMIDEHFSQHLTSRRLH